MRSDNKMEIYLTFYTDYVQGTKHTMSYCHSITSYLVFYVLASSLDGLPGAPYYK